ncbi:hypothetical protein D3C75_1003010 [compost metagenome]
MQHKLLVLELHIIIRRGFPQQLRDIAGLYSYREVGTVQLRQMENVVDERGDKLGLAIDKLQILLSLLLIVPHS